MIRTLVKGYGVGMAIVLQITIAVWFFQGYIETLELFMLGGFAAVLLAMISMVLVISDDFSLGRKEVKERDKMMQELIRNKHTIVKEVGRARLPKEEEPFVYDRDEILD